MPHQTNGGLMSQSMRGNRLGSQSFEREAGVEPAPRKRIDYRCAGGHEFSVNLEISADAPLSWQCRHCTELAYQDSAPLDAAAEAADRGKTHFEMLLERRSREELEVLLAERIEQLRAQRRPERR
jgi:hypothetical protein